MVAPDFKMWMPHAFYPLIDSGILLASMSAALLNLFFNGARENAHEVRDAALAAEAGH